MHLLKKKKISHLWTIYHHRKKDSWDLNSWFIGNFQFFHWSYKMNKPTAFIQFIPRLQGMSELQLLLWKVIKQNHSFWGNLVLWRETNKSISADPMSNMRSYQKRPPICKALHYVQTSVGEEQSAGRLMAQRSKWIL